MDARLAAAATGTAANDRKSLILHITDGDVTAEMLSGFPISPPLLATYDTSRVVAGCCLDVTSRTVVSDVTVTFCAPLHPLLALRKAASVVGVTPCEYVVMFAAYEYSASTTSGIRDETVNDTRTDGATAAQLAATSIAPAVMGSRGLPAVVDTHSGNVAHRTHPRHPTCEKFAGASAVQPPSVLSLASSRIVAGTAVGLITLLSMYRSTAAGPFASELRTEKVTFRRSATSTMIIRRPTRARFTKSTGNRAEDRFDRSDAGWSSLGVLDTLREGEVVSDSDADVSLDTSLVLVAMTVSDEVCSSVIADLLHGVVADGLLVLVALPRPLSECPDCVVE